MLFETHTNTHPPPILILNHSFICIQPVSNLSVFIRTDHVYVVNPCCLMTASDRTGAEL